LFAVKVENNLMHERIHHGSTTFWDVAPCRPIEARHHFVGMYCLHLHIEVLAKQEASSNLLATSFFAFACFAYCLSLTMEAVSCCETSVNSRRRFPEGDTLLLTVAAMTTSNPYIQRQFIMYYY
jgi:hypothetical protein